MNTLEGKIILKYDTPKNPELELKTEIFLNSEIAAIVWEKFGVGLRVHLNAEVAER